MLTRPLLLFRGVRGLAVLLAVIALSPWPSAQIRSPGEARRDLLSAGVPTVTLPAPDVSALLAEDLALEASGAVVPLRFGVPLDVAVVVEDLAAWEVTDDGAWLVARLRLRAPGAHSLGVGFRAFDLPPDGQLFLYDDADRTRLGAYTDLNRGPDGALMIEPFPGDSVILEYSQPAARPPELHLALGTLVYDYKDVFALEQQFASAQAGEGWAATCTVGVNCPEGDPYELQKRATVRTLWNGYLCSGVILNNTARDETPYLYTAQHCGTNSSVVVRFNYEQTGCNTGPAPTGQQMSGALVLDGDTDTDGRLLRLNNAIPDDYEPYYAAWSRSTSSLAFGMSMHHPGGAPKEISIDANGGSGTIAGFIGIGNVKVWAITFQIGGTAGGSSGGPLFDEANRVRGVLTGGPGDDCFVNYYGRFHNFWLDDALGEWLDPLGTGQTDLEGLDPFADLAAAALVGLAPASGPAGGFTEVDLTGSGFDGVSAVTFGGVDALDFEVVSDTALVATAPAGPESATVDVAVTDTFGTSTLAGAYSYTANPAPDVDTLSPSEGDVSGGYTVTLLGGNVLGVTDVSFGGLPAGGLVVVSPGELRLTAPASGDAGPVDVVVTGNGSVTLVDGFTYVNPGAFVIIGEGIAGQFGITPLLFTGGDLLPGGAGFTLDTIGLVPYAPGVMFLALKVGEVPFKGGTLYAFPIAAAFDLQANGLGQVNLGPLPIDPSIPGGTSFVLQQAFVDAAAVAGVSMTPGLQVIVGDS